MFIDKFSNIPNYLTIVRFVLTIVCAFILLFMSNSIFMRYSATIVFSIAALTDLLDGYLARRMRAESYFGRCFDPIVDKILVIATLFILSYYHKVDIIPVLLILIRELIVSGMREFISRQNQNLDVSHISKWKATMQYIAIIPIILSANIGDILFYCGNITLWISALLGVYTMIIYMIKSDIWKKKDL